MSFESGSLKSSEFEKPAAELLHLRRVCVKKFVEC